MASHADPASHAHPTNRAHAASRTEAIAPSRDWTSRRISWARRGALACLIGLAATWVVESQVAAARLHDAAALAGFNDLSHKARIDALAQSVLSVLQPTPGVLIGVGLVLIALVRRRPRIALAIPLVILGSVLTADVLKPLLGQANAQLSDIHNATVGSASWPSGHAAAAMAIALCAVLAAPARLRAAVAVLGALFATAVAFSLLTLAWHMPSDVVGGFLVAGLWTSLAVWALLAAQRRWPARSGRDALARAGRQLRDRGAAARGGGAGAHAGVGNVLAAGLVAATLAVGAVVVASRPERVLGFSDAHHAVLVAGAVIVALAATLVAALAVALRNG